MQNEFGVKLDRNGYAPSLLDTEPGRCYWCGRYMDAARHEIYGGANRDKSQALGLWVYLCPHCHQYGNHAVHRCAETNIRLKQIGQETAMAYYGWSNQEFLDRFGHNYVDWRTDDAT
jgi:hypothetical protein